MNELEAFYASVLPPEGPYVLAHKVQELDGVKTPMYHSSYKSLVRMAKAAQKHAESGANSWVCIGSIIDEEFKNDKGRVSPRNQQNIRALKSLVLDVEVGDVQKKYATKAGALEGLARFQTRLGLPTPTVVDSGNGFHVWWPFDVPASPSEWELTARGLRAAATALEPKLVADPVRVCDSAGLLRNPGTLNFKSDPPKAVTLLCLATETKPLSFYEEVFASYRKDEPGATKKEKARIAELAPAKKPLTQNSLSLYIDEPHDFTDVIRKCNWTREYLKNKATEPEPNWYAVLGMMPYVKTAKKTSKELAQFISIDHKGYTEAGTTRKFNQAAENQTGPTTCEKFISLDPKRCEGCPFKAMVNTPVRLDLVDVPAEAPTIQLEVIKESGEVSLEEVTIPKPPKPYFRGKEGGVYMALDDGEEGQVKRIYEYDIFPVRRLKDEETDNEMVEISLSLPQDGHRFIKIPNGLLTDPKKFTAALADKGVLVHTKEAPSLTAYIIEYARLIQREEKAHEEFARFGWRDVDGKAPRFVLGDFVADTKGELRRATPAPYLKQVKDAISVKGALDEWKKGFNVYAEMPDTEALQFALMMGFAAPLLALTSFNGLIYNMLGDSGCGKSTALKLMTSIWGKPNEHHIQVHDNRIPMFNTIGYLQSIPISFDELTTIDSDTLADIAYSISEGRGKNRADRSGNTRINTTQWKTIVCGSSNASLYEKLGMSRSGNNAHAYRIFEVTVPPAHLENRPLVEEALARVDAHHGTAGRVYILDVLKNLDQVRKLVNETAVKFARELKMPTAERYWFNLFACMAIGGGVAKRLGLHEYNVERIILWATKQLAKTRETVGGVEGDPFSTLSHFMNKNLRSTLEVKDNKPNLLAHQDQNLQGLNIRIEYEGLVPTFGFVSVPAFKDFCKFSSVEYGWVKKRLEEGGLLKELVQKNLGEGTQLLTGQTQCWKIDLQHPVMRGAQ